MKNADLMPCPFCGGKARFTDLGVQGEFHDWSVECTNTKCKIVVIAPGEEEGCITTKLEAAMAWNRRANVAVAQL